MGRSKKTKNLLKSIFAGIATTYLMKKADKELGGTLGEVAKAALQAKANGEKADLPSIVGNMFGIEGESVHDRKWRN